MTCDICWAMPGPRTKHSYLLEIVDMATGRLGRTVFQTSCSHGMQEWAQELADAGHLVLVDPTNEEKFTCASPMVLHVDDKAAAHLPLVDPVN